MGKLSPIESEFETSEEADAYDRWFREKVRASLADQAPMAAHDAVMSELDAQIDQAERRKAQ